MIDQDQDGFIDADDLKEIFTSLGADPNDDFVNEMIAEAPGKIKKGLQRDSGWRTARWRTAQGAANQETTFRYHIETPIRVK